VKEGWRFSRNMALTNVLDWERAWAPHDEPTYQATLDWVRPDDVVLEIGAGDLRLARRPADRARLVYALEIDGAPAARARRICR
jgi:hypothetical protein